MQIQYSVIQSTVGGCSRALTYGVTLTLSADDRKVETIDATPNGPPVRTWVKCEPVKVTL